MKSCTGGGSDDAGCHLGTGNEAPKAPKPTGSNPDEAPITCLYFGPLSDDVAPIAGTGSTGRTGGAVWAPGRVVPIVRTAGFPQAIPEVAPGDLIKGRRYERDCLQNGETISDTIITYTGPDTATFDATLQTTEVRLHLQFPDFATSPPYQNIDDIVALPLWMWVDANAWQTQTATDGVPGLTVTLTGTPERVEWNMGDGRHSGHDDIVRCDGPGTPWDDTKPNQKPDCAYAYQWSSDSQKPDHKYHITATMYWKLTWIASDKTHGELPEATRSTTFPLTVKQIQAVITK